MYLGRIHRKRNKTAQGNPASDSLVGAREATLSSSLIQSLFCHVGAGQFFAVFHFVDQSGALHDHARIFVHDRDLRPRHRIGRVHPGLAADGVGLDILAGPVVELFLDHLADVFGRQVCREGAGQTVHDALVMEQGVAAVGGDLRDDRLDDTHLVFAAHVVPFGEGVAFPGKGQGLGPVQGIFTFLEGIAAGCKGLGRIHRDAADGVNQGFKACEIDLAVVIDVGVVQRTQGLFRTVDAVEPAMGQLIVSAVGRRILHVIIPRCVQQQNLLGHRVDDHQDIDVAAAGIEDFAAGVGAGDVEHEGCLGHINRLIRSLFLLDRHFVKQPCLFPEVGVSLCIYQRIGVGFVHDDRLDVAVVERRHVVVHRFFRDRRDRLLDLGADFFHCLLGVVRVVAGHHAELVVFRALDRPGLVRLQHVNPFNRGELIAGCGDRAHRRVGFRGESGCDRRADAHDQRDHNRSDPAAVAAMARPVARALKQQKCREHRQPGQNGVEHHQVFRRHHVQAMDVNERDRFKQHLKQKHKARNRAPLFLLPHNVLPSPSDAAVCLPPLIYFSVNRTSARLLPLGRHENLPVVVQNRRQRVGHALFLEGFDGPDHVGRAALNVVAVGREGLDPAVFDQLHRVAGGFAPGEIAGVELDDHVHVHQRLDVGVVREAAVPLNVGDDGLNPPGIFNFLDAAQRPIGPGLEGHFEEQIPGLAEAQLFEIGILNQSIPIGHLRAEGDRRNMEGVRRQALALLAQRLHAAVQRFQQPGRRLFPPLQKAVDGFLGVVMGRRDDPAAPLAVMLGEQRDGFLRRLAAVVHPGKKMAVQIVKGERRCRIHLDFSNSYL